MTATDVRSYPKLAFYVRNDLPQVLRVPAIVAAFAKIGGVARPSLQAALRWNSGPSIKVTVLVGALGEFSPGIKSQEIRIARSMVADFEAGKGQRAARAGSVYLVGVTLLHELVHWADDQDGIDRSGEEGEEFERALYGGVIH
jgi:hypothetical protein